MNSNEVLILGGGSGGLATAGRLKELLGDKISITVIDKQRSFVMGYSLLRVMTGEKTEQEVTVPKEKVSQKGIKFINTEVNRIDVNNGIVRTDQGEFVYDYLVVALGAELAPEKIPGFESAFHMYTLEDAKKLRDALSSFRGGSIRLVVSRTPFKCPPAPYEASLLINDILVSNGTRDSISIDIYTPTPIALPVAGAKVSQDVINLLNDNHINFHPLHKIKTVSDTKEIEFENGNRVNYDLLIGIPPHKVPEVIRNSDLIKQGQNWINVDKFNLKTDYQNVFAIGDVNEIKVNENVAIPKAGVFAEAQAKVVSQQIVDDIKNDKNKYSSSRFDGKGFCFMEVGNEKAGYIAVDFYHEDGPYTLLEPPSDESYKKKLDFERSKLNEWLLL